MGDVSRWSRCEDCGDMIDVHPLIHQIMVHAPVIGEQRNIKGRARMWRTATLRERKSRKGVDGAPGRL